PLGVPSRMNVGQILETHLGRACAGLGLKIGNMVEAYRSKAASKGEAKAELKSLRATLKEIYGDGSEGKEIAHYDDESVIRLGDQLTRGVPIATPVFDGAREPDIVEMLEEAGIDRSGQSTLYDGRTGEPFDR